MATITAIQKKDIDALERSLKTLSENMSSVANDVVDINGQINDFNSQVDTLKSNVKSLEQEIKDLFNKQLKLIKTANEEKKRKIKKILLDKLEEEKHNFIKQWAILEENDIC